ncbi:MAG: glycosyltransferase family 4 protein [Sideroxydans sp.]|nr:glycosyltransferase family 4 protein [Sideroxydans sp.]
MNEIGWQGGVNYFSSLLAAIQSLPNAKIQPIVFAGNKSDVSALENQVEIVRVSSLDRFSFGWWQNKLLNRIGIYRDYALFSVMQRHKIDFVSHNDRLWRGCGIPFMGWIPDFQHLHLPHFFTQRELSHRDASFARMIHKSDAILLSSQNALNDLHKFCPGNTTPTYVLRFVPSLSRDINPPPKDELAGRYRLNQPWFHLPNQFWAHKNHGIVIEALHLLKEQGIEVLVVATGSTKDYRNPNYFNTLLDRINEYDLQKNFLAVGMIPYEDVVGLMHYSIATINPSLFEGWSTTVEESKVMGKRILLSDIGVHREQNPHRGLYFDPHSAEDLANKIKIASNGHIENEENHFQAEANLLHPQNIRRFAETYQEIVLEIMANSSWKKP